ncbi:MAG: hypothetical protein Ct9H300mP19_17740 [Dehalococcoidia bacterium]|nr:MAG: hypothetical protein Ct9H300mP19_17740 [Dehalococcoidia bacterium]
MGQKLLDPPSVEGWHTGREWIDSSFLIERVNFAANMLGDKKSRDAEGYRANFDWKPALLHGFNRRLFIRMGCVEIGSDTKAILIEELNFSPVFYIDETLAIRSPSDRVNCGFT